MLINAFIAGFVWSALWMVYVFLILKHYPWEILHDYPEDIQEASVLPEPSSEQKKQAKIFGSVGGIVIFGVLLLFGLIHFSGGAVSFWSVLAYIFIIAMTWNIADLIVMDFLIICTITPKWVVIDGTEGCKGYHDYLFHFKGFLIGCVYTAIMAVIFSGIDFAVLHFIIWK